MLTSDRRISGEYATEDERWNAVVRRDSKADGHFYYSVKTTGVYCRPSCAARRAKREHVQFHFSCKEAERAGYRPCKRCQPNGAGLPQYYAAKVAAACRSIEAGEAPPRLGELARTVGMSRFHFHRVFVNVTGLTPKAYAVAHRAEQARQILPKRRTVTEVIYEAGFNSSSRFYSGCSRIFGMNPKRYRQGGMGEVIRFALGECSLGSILVAASDKGICAISLGDDPGKLARDLQDRFPKARLVGGDRDFERTVAIVVGFVEAPAVGLDLPLDVRGTAFQQRVWNALREIPVGATTSYAQLAKRIGLPTAARAVASACAANAIAVAIPCHRVVRTSGSLSGYRWGVPRKRTLLKREQSVGP